MAKKEKVVEDVTFQRCVIRRLALAHHKFIDPTGKRNLGKRSNLTVGVNFVAVRLGWPTDVRECLMVDCQGDELSLWPYANGEMRDENRRVWSLADPAIGKEVAEYLCDYFKVEYFPHD